MSAGVAHEAADVRCGMHPARSRRPESMSTPFSNADFDWSVGLCGGSGRIRAQGGGERISAGICDVMHMQYSLLYIVLLLIP